MPSNLTINLKKGPTPLNIQRNILGGDYFPYLYSRLDLSGKYSRTFAIKIFRNFIKEYNIEGVDIYSVGMEYRNKYIPLYLKKTVATKIKDIASSNVTYKTLEKAGLNKDVIRKILKDAGLPSKMPTPKSKSKSNEKKPSSSCSSSSSCSPNIKGCLCYNKVHPKK